MRALESHDALTCSPPHPSNQARGKMSSAALMPFPGSPTDDSMQCTSKRAFTGSNRSFDHLIGGKEQAGWHGQAKRLRRFEVDDRFELGRRLHRKVGGLVSAQDAVDID